MIDMTPSRSSCSIPLVLLCALLAACGGDAPAAASWAGSVDTLASGGVHVTNPAEGTWSPDERWTAVEDLRIGALEGAGPELFGSVSAVEVDPMGRLWVLERQAAELRVFDADGAWVRTLGRKGGGPGEFESPSGLRFGPDGYAWVGDRRNRRFELFDTAGTLVGSRPFQGMSFGVEAHFDGQGRLVDQEFVVRGEEASTMFIRRQRADGLPAIDTFPAPDMGEGETHEVSGSSGGNTFAMALPIPFVHQPWVGLGDGGALWAWRGAAEGYRFMKLELDGDTLLMVDREHAPIPVTTAERDSVLGEGNPLGGESSIPADRIPESHPAFESVRSLPDGHILVDRVVAEGGERAWDVFDPQGRYLGQLDRPAGYRSFRLHSLTDDALYGVVRGELDEQYVVRLRLRRGAGG